MDIYKKLKVTIYSSFIASFLLMMFPNVIIEPTFKTNVIFVTNLKKYGAFVQTCNILSIIFFFLGLAFLILMWVLTFINFKKSSTIED